MFVTDNLIRRIKFAADDFFNLVTIQNASRARHQDIPTRIKLPRGYITPYFRAEEHLNIYLEDITPGRLIERKFHMGLEGELSYRTDSKEIITITLGNNYHGGYLKEELRKMEDVRNDGCGTYLLTLEIPVPDIFVHEEAYPQVLNI